MKAPRQSVKECYKNAKVQIRVPFDCIFSLERGNKEGGKKTLTHKIKDLQNKKKNGRRREGGQIKTNVKYEEMHSSRMSSALFSSQVFTWEKVDYCK